MINIYSDFSFVFSITPTLSLSLKSLTVGSFSRGGTPFPFITLFTNFSFLKNHVNIMYQPTTMGIRMNNTNSNTIYILMVN